MVDRPSRAGAGYTIFLRDFVVEVSIGIHPDERAARQRIVLNIWMEATYPEPPEDIIDAVVDYDFLRGGVHRLIAERHFELQETLCDAIAGIVLAHPYVTGVRVQSLKPDIYPDAQVGCEIVRRK